MRRMSFIVSFILIKSNFALNIPVINADHSEARFLGYENGDFYTNGEELVLKYVLNPGSVVFDVGANCGNWSRVALQINPNIHLYSFEPQPKIFQELLMNLNSLPVSCYNMAFSNQWGKSLFYEHDGAESEGSGFFLRPHLKERARRIEVDTETLDCFCTFHEIDKIDFLKIDTEGAELRILQGAANMLRDHKILALQFEYGGCYLDAKTTLMEVMQLLTQSGYAIFRMLPQGVIHINRWDQSLESYRYANYFAVIQSILPSYGLVDGL